MAKAVLISAVPPIMVKSEKNPGGRAQLVANRAKLYREVPIPFYSYNRPGAKASEAIGGGKE